MDVILHKGDIPDNLKLGNVIAVDTETLGLKHGRDPLCLVQLCGGNDVAHIVQLNRKTYDAPNLKKLMTDAKRIKIFHFARFDLAAIREYMGVSVQNVYCTRTASKLTRTYTDKHGLRHCCREFLGVDLNKQQQSSDWGAAQLTEEQLKYAGYDVIYLHKLKERFDEMLEREGRTALAQKCFDFLMARAELDLAGWEDCDIFAH